MQGQREGKEGERGRDGGRGRRKREAGTEEGEGGRGREREGGAESEGYPQAHIMCCTSLSHVTQLLVTMSTVCAWLLMSR